MTENGISEERHAFGGVLRLVGFVLGGEGGECKRSDGRDFGMCGELDEGIFSQRCHETRAFGLPLKMCPLESVIVCG